MTDTIGSLNDQRVITPSSLARRHLEVLPEWIWSDPSLRFFDPAVKSGIYLKLVAMRLMEGLEGKFPDPRKRAEHILKNMIFGAAYYKLGQTTAVRNIYEYPDASDERAIVQMEKAHGNIALYHGAENKDIKTSGNFIAAAVAEEWGEEMKFDVIIGNPPFQTKDNDTTISASALYDAFVLNAIDMNPRYVSMITPSRWFSGGKGLKEYRAKLLGDPRMAHIVHYPNKFEMFNSTVEIAGGTSYFLWDSEKDRHGIYVQTFLNGRFRDELSYDPTTLPILLTHHASLSIAQKVSSLVSQTEGAFMSDSVMAQKPFGLRSNFRDFDPDGDIAVYYADNNKSREKMSIGNLYRESIIKGVELLDKHKVLVSKASQAPSGVNDVVIGKPFVTGKSSASTESYLVVFASDRESEAVNAASYFETKFARFMLSLYKNTQNISREMFALVPALPFDQKWTDEMLYDHFGLNEEERAHIDKSVKKMI